MIETGANVIAVVRNINSDKMKNLNQIKEKHENALKIVEINLESEEEIKIKTIKLIKDVDDIFGLVNNGTNFNGLVQMTSKGI